MELDKLLEAGESEKLGKNLAGVTKTVDSLNSFLTKLDTTADKITGIMKRFGVPPHVLLRLYAQSKGIKDFDKPFEVVDNGKEDTKTTEHKD